SRPRRSERALRGLSQRARAQPAARERERTRGLSALLCALLVWLPLLVRADALSSAVFVRTDSDHTVVISPRARVEKQLGAASTVDVSYAADVWTSASVDIRASASRPVTEQRDELDFALSHTLEDLTLTTSYRYSVENDYESHGATGGGTLDLNDKNTTFA